MHYTRFNRPERTMEKNSGEIKVETAGYIPGDIQIRRLIAAGERLEQHRAEMYDFGPDQEVDDEAIDPTRSPGFDMADASQLMMATEESMRESMRRKKEEIKKQEAEKPVEEKEETSE